VSLSGSTEMNTGTISSFSFSSEQIKVKLYDDIAGKHLKIE
jgi:hypothetical protein